MTRSPYVGKHAIELPLSNFIPANSYGVDWLRAFLVSEGESEEGHNLLAQTTKSPLKLP